jgi:hypothetical protein
MLLSFRDNVVNRATNISSRSCDTFSVPKLFQISSTTRRSIGSNPNFIINCRERFQGYEMKNFNELLSFFISMMSFKISYGKREGARWVFVDYRLVMSRIFSILIFLNRGLD